jgi:thymidine kinase
MSKAGELTLVVGGMFSGKSTELQRQGKRKELAGVTVLYVKPATDNRYDKDSISTHDGSNVHAHVLETSQSILGLVGMFGDYENNTTVCIDEVQFFDSGIVRVIELLLRMGIDVVCSGLDLDRFGEPFGVVPELLCKAETVIKLKAVCQGCGEDAWVSYGKFQAEEQTVVGEKEKYVPLCRSCYYEKGGIL